MSNKSHHRYRKDDYQHEHRSFDPSDSRVPILRSQNSFARNISMNSKRKLQDIYQLWLFGSCVKTTHIQLSEAGQVGIPNAASKDDITIGRQYFESIV